MPTVLDAPVAQRRRSVEAVDDAAKVQLSFRAARSLKNRIAKCAKALGVDDESTLIRMIITKYLPQFEEQASQLQIRRE